MKATIIRENPLNMVYADVFLRKWCGEKPSGGSRVRGSTGKTAARRQRQRATDSRGPECRKSTHGGFEE